MFNDFINKMQVWVLKGENLLCRGFVMITYPVVWLGGRWMERLERKEKPEWHGGLTMDMIAREPTVADIQPAGFAEVRAMGADGQWTVLHDYPVRLLPKVPGVTIRGGE